MAESEIPYLDLAGEGPLTLLTHEEARATALIAAGRRQYTGFLIDLLDRLSRRWARAVGGPYLPELEAAAALDLPNGVWFMNHAYEWGCTTAAGADPSAPGVRLLRTLDWPFDGLGSTVVVARHETPVGPYYNVTWPGFLGVMTAMAPGRFAVAINQAPVLRHGPPWLPYPWPVDWLISRIHTFTSRRPAPAMVLRHVMESCETFAEAKRRLAETPLALSVFFTLAGVEPGDACVIERLPERARQYEAPAVVANHWKSDDLRGRPRGRDSQGRAVALAAQHTTAAADFAWLRPPILNPDTRLAVAANAASGELLVQGFERHGAVTSVFSLSQAAGS
jgi:hypothetical protein